MAGCLAVVCTCRQRGPSRSLNSYLEDLLWFPSGSLVVLLLARWVHRFTTSIYIYKYMYIGPIGANGNMGALCPMGTIGPDGTNIANRTNSTNRTRTNK